MSTRWRPRTGRYDRRGSEQVDPQLVPDDRDRVAAQQQRRVMNAATAAQIELVSVARARQHRPTQLPILEPDILVRAHAGTREQLTANTCDDHWPRDAAD